MLLRLNATGDSINVIGAPLVQGSNSANEIYIEAPLAESLSCSVSIMLPTGTYTSPYIATPKGYDGGVSTWYLKPDVAVTQYAGQIRINVSFTSAGAIVASVAATATVRPGGYLAEVGEPNADAWSQVQVIYSGVASALSNLMLLIGKSQVTRYYAWVWTNQTLYTLSATPEKGDDVHLIADETATIQGIPIHSVGTSTISFNSGATYTRTISSDRILISTSAEPFDNSLFAELLLKAPLESPELTGTPTATTAETTDDGLRIATTAWVKAMLLATPTASTAFPTDNSDRIATTAWVRTFISAISTLFDQIQDGTYGGFVPIGGLTNEVLAKSSDATHALKWQSLEEYTFESPKAAATPTAGDNTTLLATTAFVKVAIDALKGTVGGAYDTLQEIQAALETNAGNIAGALADIASKDNKTEFSDFATGGTLVLESHHEYRGTAAILALELTFPSSPANDFICTIDFTSASEEDMSYTYTNTPDVYSTGDDCIKEGELEGTFVPIRDKHYTWVLWYAGGKYQGVVRRSA